LGPAEHDRAAHLAAGHVVGLGGRIDDVVDRLHREVEGHELDDRAQAAHRRAGADAGKAIFGDRRVDHAARAELVEQALRDLVGALIFSDLLAHHEDAVVRSHLLCHGVAERLAHSLANHLGSLGHFRLDLEAGRRLPFLGPRLHRCLLRLRLLGRSGGDGRAIVLSGLRHVAGTAGDAVGLLAFAGEDRDDGADLHLIGSLGHQDLGHNAFVDRLEFHRGLVGLDLGDDGPGGDGVAFLHQPFGERALLHGRVGDKAGIFSSIGISRFPPARRCRVRADQARATARQSRRFQPLARGSPCRAA
jgi:hypothetical protein